MSFYDFRWHLYGRIIVFGFAMLGIVVASYMIQENQVREEGRHVCVASWDCEAGKRIAPRPDSANMPNNDIPVTPVDE